MCALMAVKAGRAFDVFRACSAYDLKSIAVVGTWQRMHFHLRDRDLAFLQAGCKRSSNSPAFLHESAFIGDICAPAIRHTAKRKILAELSPSRSSFKYSRLSPSGIVQLPPRVEHLILDRRGLAVDVLSTMLDLPSEYVEDLIRFGAVYYSPIPPPPPAHAGAHIHAAYKALPESPLLAAALARKRVRKVSQKGGRIPVSVDSLGEGLHPIMKPTLGQKPQRVKSLDLKVEAGGYVRVHVNPKRFPGCYSVDWASTLLVNTSDYVVINKPAGIPVGGTVDNQVENCISFAARAVGLTEPLWPTHQLDTCTQGCVVLAKTKSFAGHFNSLMRERKVNKAYRALTTSPINPGRLVHFMRPGNYAPRVVRQDVQNDWQRCELEVLECCHVALPSAAVFKEADVAMALSPPSHERAFECTVHLITGRTHQLRAQFADIGAPLVGDTMYVPIAMASKSFCESRDGDALNSSHSLPHSQEQDALNAPDSLRPGCLMSPASPEFPFTEESKHGTRDPSGNCAEHTSQNDSFGQPAVFGGPDPEGAVGLQAWKISWEGGPGVIEAPDPWWRNSS